MTNAKIVAMARCISVRKVPDHFVKVLEVFGFCWDADYKSWRVSGPAGFLRESPYSESFRSLTELLREVGAEVSIWF